MYLGDGEVSLVDMFGNATPLAVARHAPQEIPFHEIPVTTTPVFLEGIDLELVYLTTTLSIEPGDLPSRDEVHPREIVIRNPWAVPVRGSAYIVEPGGFSEPERRPDRSWVIDPRRRAFLVGAGEVGRLPMDVDFSAAEEAGLKRFAIDLDLESDRGYGLVRVERYVELGLPNVRLDLAYRLGLDAGGNGLLLLAEVTNTGTETISAELTAVSPRLRSRATNVEQLEPGTATVKAFAFRERRDQILGEQIFVVLQVRNSADRLNRSVVIE